MGRWGWIFFILCVLSNAKNGIYPMPFCRENVERFFIGKVQFAPKFQRSHFNELGNCLVLQNQFLLALLYIYFPSPFYAKLFHETLDAFFVHILYRPYLSRDCLSMQLHLIVLQCKNAHMLLCIFLCNNFPHRRRQSLYIQFLLQCAVKSSEISGLSETRTRQVRARYFLQMIFCISKRLL